MPAWGEKPKRRWFAFSMRKTLLLILIVSLPLGWVAYERRKIAERRELLGSVGSMYGITFQPSWRLWLLGDDWPKYIQSIWLTGVTDDDLAYLKELTQLRTIFINDAKVTSSGLAHLKRLKELRHLYFDRTQVDDVGVGELRKALPQCLIAPLPQ